MVGNRLGFFGSLAIHSNFDPEFFREACYAMSKLRQCLPVVGFLRNSLEAAPTLKQRREDLGEDARRRRLFLRGEGWYETSGTSQFREY